MKIGIDGRAAIWYRGTGIGTYTYQLINSLNSLDLSDDYLIFMPQNNNNSISLNKNFTIKNISENKSGNFWDEVNIPAILKNLDTNLYHVPQNGIKLPCDKKCPFVITLHDVIPFKMPETVSPNYLKVFTENVPDIVKRSDAIITVSNFSKRDIVETLHYPENKVYVTYLANEDIYKPMDKSISRQIIKKAYGIEGEYILYIGGFSPRKNITGLIEAFSKLKALYKSDIKLIIAGKKGISFEIYRKKAEELHIINDILFPGFIALSDLPHLYSAAKLFVYPSFYEGFGLPPLEAMACGTPVIASNVTSIPEVLGDSAALIDPHNVESITSSMLQILEDNLYKESLIAKGLNKSASLSWNKTAKQTLEVYSEISNSN